MADDEKAAEAAPSKILKIKVNDRDHNAQFNFPTNVIVTSKYTMWNFLPINLFEQFRRLANIYFLVIIALCAIPEIAPFSIWTSVLPLVLIISATAVKDAMEDNKRHKQDDHHNSIPVDRLAQNGELETTQSKLLQVGDIIMIRCDEEIPADCIVLQGPEGGDGTARMNTSSLDGENAPKVRKACGYTHGMTLKQLAAINAEVECKENDKQLHGFTGRLRVKSEDVPKPLGDENFLFRAAFLANTEYVFAMILFVGSDTTLMLNRNAVPYKFSQFEKVLNACVAFLLVFNLSLCCSLALFSAGSFVNPEVFPLLTEQSRELQFGLDLGTWYIVFSFMIPISLYVTVEMVKIFEALFMQHDPESSIWELPFDAPAAPPAEDKEKTMSASDEVHAAARRSSMKRSQISHSFYKNAERKGMQVRSSALNEELGQVQYIFSDKTGTLTQNKMELSKLSIGGEKFKHDFGTAGEVVKSPDFKNLSEGYIDCCEMIKEEGKLPDTVLYHMAVNVLVCSETLPMETENGRRYLSASPDEISFAEALELIGVELIERDAKNNCHLDWAGTREVYEVVAMLEFQSKRLRMTVIVKDSEGRHFAYSKGADAKLLPDPRTGGMGFCGAGQEDLIQTTQNHIDEYARDGSRVLVEVYKPMTDDEVATFMKEYDAASNAIDNRQDKIEASFGPIEKDMILIGCTAVEDQIQEGVIDTVEAMKTAKVKVMMLTGDKKETAVTIGKLSGIIGSEAVVWIDPPDEEVPALDVQFKRCKEVLREAAGKPSALVINGTMLEESLVNHSDDFLTVFDTVDSIVCNRAAPAQKALVVKWAMDTHKGVCLAIGDGANDVSMIQASNVGIGIMGKEGTQAALASDFIIYRFMHLKKLLFVHGRWNYIRTSKVVLFCIYKNLACILPLAWFACFSQATGQPLFEASILSMFNVFYTSLPPFLVGVFEKDCPAEALLAHPKAYLDFGQIHPMFNTFIFIRWCGDAVLQSVLYYFMTHFMITGNSNVWSAEGKTAGLFGYGTLLFTYEIFAINAKLISMTRFWNIFIVASGPLGVFAYFLLWSTYERVCWYTWDGCMVFTWVLTKPFFWFGLIPFVLMAVLPGILMENERKRQDPSLGDILNEAYYKGYLYDDKKKHRPLEEIVQEYRRSL